MSAFGDPLTVRLPVRFIAEETRQADALTAHEASVVVAIGSFRILARLVLRSLAVGNFGADRFATNGLGTTTTEHGRGEYNQHRRAAKSEARHDRAGA